MKKSSISKGFVFNFFDNSKMLDLCVYGYINKKPN